MKNLPCPTVDEILSLLSDLSKKDSDFIKKAYLFAEKAHEGQKRRSGEPYFCHVAVTAHSLATINMDATVIIAGLLHDSIEDASVPPETIEREFGKTVRFLVEGVTKLGTIKYRGVERHVESLRKFFIAISKDIRVLIIKLADRMHNIQTLEYIPQEKQKRLALETLEIHARLADRFGMSKWKSILEDGAFPYAYPEEYEKMTAIIKTKRVIDEKNAKKIYRSIQKELVANDIKNARVDYRVKNLYSLWKKLKRKNVEINKVYDILAVRVIVKSVEDCYRALGIIHKHWRPVPGRIKDYIAVPKPNGYRSLHTTIFRGDGGVIEIQIRTEEMHREAQYGIASHLSYKEGGTKSNGIKKSTEWIKDLTKWQQEVAQSDDFLKNLSMDFFNRRVFVFTPHGDVIDLPEGSTPIDFAYTIHSNIGDHIAGAKINHKLIPLGTELKNGDIVEIETKKNASPKSKWLDYTKTTIAKRHIRAYLEKNDLIEIISNKFFKKK
ncbi:MAG: bifunctional (p)ppGpp synthetase/guanosine-3',5'-bis(diphosphate) 3'-pyrophosphohydrolase [Candidatus Yonathbacteria bacterium]|nr:bifunctional (p)ppGpp synthetase/guanosine-3',5'-bis(diphosphate) 3'-pyrophosphohydrolase [Candidatus Yonathbacteria bacterium]